MLKTIKNLGISYPNKEVVNIMTRSVTKSRIESIDILRGIIMILMVLDHVRDIWLIGNIDPTDIEVTTYALFTTRWITHICAPMFFILSGVAISISIKNGKTKKEVSGYLIVRGIILILLEIILFSRLWMNGSDVILLQVLWALGVSMIAMSLFIWFSDWVVAVIALIQILGHNILSTHNGIIWTFLHQGRSKIIINNHSIYVLYPLIPWIGVMSIGYLTARVMLFDDEKRKKFLLLIGSLLTMVFIVLRWTNLYGDPNTWNSYDEIGYTMMSFVNCEKYPPSLLFLLMTIGLGVLLLYLIEKVNSGSVKTILRPIFIIGKVPLFFYIIHLPLIIFTKYITGLNKVGLGGVYIVWVIMIIILYPACYYYSKIKESKKYKLLGYI